MSSSQHTSNRTFGIAVGLVASHGQALQAQIDSAEGAPGNGKFSLEPMMKSKNRKNERDGKFVQTRRASTALAKAAEGSELGVAFKKIVASVPLFR